MICKISVSKGLRHGFHYFSYKPFIQSLSKDRLINRNIFIDSFIPLRNNSIVKLIQKCTDDDNGRSGVSTGSGPDFLKPGLPCFSKVYYPGNMVYESMMPV